MFVYPCRSLKVSIRSLFLPSAILCECHGHVTLNFSTLITHNVLEGSCGILNRNQNYSRTGQVLEEVMDAKYLGVTLSNDL